MRASSTQAPNFDTWPYSLRNLRLSSMYDQFDPSQVTDSLKNQMASSQSQSQAVFIKIGIKLNIHSIALIVLCAFVLNLTIILPFYKHKNYTRILHIALSTLLFLSMIYPILYYILEKGLFSNKQFYFIHQIVGLALVLFMLVQGVTGWLSWSHLRNTSSKPQLITKIKLMHRLLAIAIFLTAKYNYLSTMVRKQSDLLYFFATWQLLCFYWFIKVSYFKRKLASSMDLESKILETLVQLPKVKSSADIKATLGHQQYVIFTGIVYDSSKLKNIHPGGAFLIETMQGRQVDRFLYGMHTSQFTPYNRPHSHSEKSIKLAGTPVAVVQTISPLRGLEKLNECILSASYNSEDTSETYIVYFSIIGSGNRLRFQGYSHPSQFGQYFAINLPNRTTRLYTCVWSMRRKNIKFMEKYFPSLESSVKVFVYLNQIKKLIGGPEHSSNYRLLMKNKDDGEKDGEDQSIVPLIIKRYENGQFTSRLFTQNQFTQKIYITDSRGFGLKYDELSKTGKVIAVTGGTGAYPFIDLTDILFKQVLILQGHSKSKKMIKHNPILETDLIEKRSFVFFFAFQYLSDLPNATLLQLNYLTYAKKYIDFECIVKLKQFEDFERCRYRYPHLQLTNKYFQQRVRKQIQKTSFPGNRLPESGDSEELCMIYICGSSQMNSNIGRVVKQEGVTKRYYHFL